MHLIMVRVVNMSPSSLGNYAIWWSCCLLLYAIYLWGFHLSLHHFKSCFTCRKFWIIVLLPLLVFMPSGSYSRKWNYCYKMFCPIWDSFVKFFIVALAKNMEPFFSFPSTLSMLIWIKMLTMDKYAHL